jgi:hypothetical protein
MISLKIQWIIDSLESADILKLKRAIYNFSESKSILKSEMELDERINKIIEQNFYIVLSALLKARHFEYFRQLLDYSVDLNIYLDASKIPDRFENLSIIQLNGIRGGQIGDIFEVIKIFNEYNLLEREIPTKDLNLVGEIKKDKLIISNLRDLFGKVSDALIYYVYDSMLKNILVLFKSSMDIEEGYDFFYNEAQLMSFFNNFTIYGLRVENLGKVEEFIESFQKQYSVPKDTEKNINKVKFVEIEFKNRTHLVSIVNIEKNFENFISARNNYNFYNLSMVLLGGLGL